MGGYVSQDPIGLDGGDRLYGYVNDPLSWTDPMGLSKTCGTPRQKDIDALQNGPAGTVVTVKSKKEANALLNAAFPDFQKIKGVGAEGIKDISTKHGRKQDRINRRINRWKQGKAYHKDYAMNNNTGRPHFHGPGRSWHSGPHIDINRGRVNADGKITKDVVHILVGG